MHIIEKLLKILLVLIVVFYINSNVNVSQNELIEDLALDKLVDLSAIAMKDKEEKPIVVVQSQPKVNSSTSLSILTGSLTGYSADCPLCSGRLACSSYNVYQNAVVTYPDNVYGNVRIVASSKNLPCGSIVKFNLRKLSSSPIYAIVLDRGVGGNNLDLLVENESLAYTQIGRSSITYEVVRRGW